MGSTFLRRLVIAVLGTLLHTAALADQGIIGYGLSRPDEIQRYGIGTVRGKIGFDGRIASQYSATIAVLSNSNVHKFDPDRMLEETRKYLGVRELNKISEISIDDFVEWHHGVLRAGRAGLLDQIIDLVHDARPPLKFGVTLYAEELSSSFRVRASDVAPATRAKVDVVHLYVLDRSNCERFDRYVEQTRRLFPKAEVIAGLYNYDRRAFEKRAQSGDEEADLFSRCLDVATDLRKKGTVTGIEFYPARFGLESPVDSKDDPALARRMNSAIPGRISKR